MNQKDLILFNTFCSLCLINLEDPNAFLESPSNFKIRDARVPIIRGRITDISTLRSSPKQDIDKFAQESKSVFQEYGFGFNEFQLLSEHGLIQDETLWQYANFWYNNELYLSIKPSVGNPVGNPPFKAEDYQQITISGYRLSSVGRELFHITERHSPPEYLEYLINFLQEYYNVKIVKISKS